MAAREDDEGAMPHNGNGNGNGDRHPRLSLPPNPDEALTPDTWQDGLQRTNGKILDLWTLNGEMLAELSRVAVIADGSNKTVSQLDRKVDALIGDVRDYRREVVDARQSIGHVRQAFDSQHDMVEEIARKAGREAAESTGIHDLKKIMSADTVEKAKEIVDEQKKKRAEWRTAAIGAFFVVIVTIGERVAELVWHVGHP